MNNTFISAIQQWIAVTAPRVVPLVRQGCDRLKAIDCLAPLLMRLYLAPVLWMAGANKWLHFTETAEWFGNSEAGLGLPMPYLLVFLVAFFESVGAIFLVLGFATRLMALPLMVIMAVAGVLVHWQNGWLAIATGSGLFATDRTRGAIERLEAANILLTEQGDYAWLTENGSVVMLNNGIEFAATYFIMLLALFFIGGGRYVSADYWLVRRYFSH
jgi:uncharacterized membrane protein YphA (DoxX/SURF4 family)